MRGHIKGERWGQLGLTRPCAGVADYFGIDVTLVRAIVAVVSVITGGAGVLAYLAAWVIIPGEGEKTSIAQNLVSKKQDA
jgi:phage shock protein PspC (stress-responsive transcriptional regulator)